MQSTGYSRSSRILMNGDKSVQDVVKEGETDQVTY